MTTLNVLDLYFPKLATIPGLKEKLISIGTINHFEKGTTILRQGAYVKVLPLVISGLIKIFKEDDNGNEVLLYYIKPGESCVMSMTSLIKNDKSKIKAVVEEAAEVVVLPANKVLDIARQYPKWNEFIYDLFNLKFEELLNVIEILTFSKKETRLLEYLKQEVTLKESDVLYTTHQQIAYDLGSSREVISRLLKKLEQDKIIEMKHGKIKLIVS